MGCVPVYGSFARVRGLPGRVNFRINKVNLTFGKWGHGLKVSWKFLSAKMNVSQLDVSFHRSRTSETHCNPSFQQMVDFEMKKTHFFFFITACT